MILSAMGGHGRVPRSATATILAISSSVTILGTNYRGLRENGCRMRILFASANMLMVARAGRQADFLWLAIA